FGAAPTTKPIEAPPEPRADEKANGSGGGGKPPLDPLLRGLVDRLPAADTAWALEDRIKWLQTAANVFDLIYTGGGGIKIEAATAPRSSRPD
ncbi:MAG: hypothetical protein ACREFY_04315, partial [Acetobacteraceae bacterium]